MNIEQVYLDLKMCLAETTEQRFNFGIEDTPLTYDNEASLLRNISPNHPSSLMHYSEKFALHFIVSHLPANSIVVEIGSFLGGSAAIMAYANPTIHITGIDSFDTKTYSVVIEQQQMIDQAYGVGKSRSCENAQQWINQFHNNVKFYRAESPNNCTQIASNLGKIDLYFEDAIHADPWLQRNVDFWFPKVRRGGLILMHDYRPWMPPNLSFPPWRCVDVETNLERLVSSKQAVLVGCVRGLAILKKL